MTGGEIVAIIALTGTVITGLVQAVFHGTSLSRCKTVDCFCFKCEREVLQDESLYKDNNNNETIARVVETQE
tara:strand:- start:410 stop:625 length:216 start_codon:yes stop_codon:yes gene_type:complete